MGLRRTSHAVYDARYHLVWAPKYRKWILRGDIRQRVKELFGEIAAHHGIEIAAMEVVGKSLRRLVTIQQAAFGIPFLLLSRLPE